MYFLPITPIGLRSSSTHHYIYRICWVWLSSFCTVRHILFHALQTLLVDICSIFSTCFSSWFWRVVWMLSRQSECWTLVTCWLEILILFISFIPLERYFIPFSPILLLSTYQQSYLSIIFVVVPTVPLTVACTLCLRCYCSLHDDGCNEISQLLLRSIELT